MHGRKNIKVSIVLMVLLRYLVRHLVRVTFKLSCFFLRSILKFPAVIHNTCKKKFVYLLLVHPVFHLPCTLIELLQNEIRRFNFTIKGSIFLTYVLRYHPATDNLIVFLARGEKTKYLHIEFTNSLVFSQALFFACTSVG